MSDEHDTDNEVSGIPFSLADGLKLDALRRQRSIDHITAEQVKAEHAQMRAFLVRYVAGEKQFAALHDQEVMDAELLFDVQQWLTKHPANT